MWHDFHRSFLVHSKKITSLFRPIHFYVGCNIHVLIQSIQYIILPDFPVIIVFDWVICGPQIFSLKDSRSFSSEVDNTHVSVVYIMTDLDRLCGLVVRVLGYRSGGPGSIPGTTRKKKCRGSGTGCTQPREYKLRSYLIEK
jgi:hypothetical protein